MTSNGVVLGAHAWGGGVVEEESGIAIVGGGCLGLICFASKKPGFLFLLSVSEFLVIEEI